MNIKEIMSKKIITCSKDSTFLDVSKLMNENDVGFLPVCDNNKIIGVITDRDIVIKALGNNENSSTSIKDYINENIISVNIDSSLEDTLKTMSNNKIKRIIVEDDNKVVGIISLSDIINSEYNNKLLFDTLKSIYAIKSKEDNNTAEIDEFYL